MLSLVLSSFIRPVTFPAPSTSSRIWHLGAFEDLTPLIFSPLVSDMFPSVPPVYGKGKNIQEIKTATPGHHPDPATVTIEFKGSPLALRPCPLKRLTHDFQLRGDVNQMWSLQMAAQDGIQHGEGLEVASGQLCSSDRIGRDGDTLGSGLAEDVFTVCLFWGVFVIVREARQRGQAGLIVPRL